MAILENLTISEGLAFDDVLLRPGHSTVMPGAVEIGSQTNCVDLGSAFKRCDGSFGAHEAVSAQGSELADRNAVAGHHVRVARV